MDEKNTMDEDYVFYIKGKRCVIDKKDLPVISKYKWYLGKNYNTYYAITNGETVGGKRKSIQMHSLLLGSIKGMQIDHINHDGLDNRRSNIRFCTHSQNQANRNIVRKSKTGVRGVRVMGDKFQARIRVDGELVHIGTYNNIDDAMFAYDLASHKYFGEFSNPNKRRNTNGHL